MSAYSYVFQKAVANGRAKPRAWSFRYERGTRFGTEPYLDDVAPPIEVRKVRFADWVKRVTDHAKQHRNLSIPKIAELADIGDQTIYRWKKAEGKELPDPEAVLAFCDALDIDPQVEAFRILWPGKAEKPAEPLPITDDENYVALQRKLNDPNVSDFDKAFIRETLRQLNDRPTTPARPKRPGRPRGVKN